MAFHREKFIRAGQRNFVNDVLVELFTDVFAYSNVDLLVELGSALGNSFLVFMKRTIMGRF